MADCAVRRPKTFPVDLTVGQARDAFRFKDDHLHMLV